MQPIRAHQVQLALQVLQVQLEPLGRLVPLALRVPKARLGVQVQAPFKWLLLLDLWEQKRNGSPPYKGLQELPVLKGHQAYLAQ
jgi:hypothetical protein